MTAWMLFAAAVAALAGVAALAAERALRLHRLPTRWAWAAAMAVSISLPFILPAPRTAAVQGGGMKMEMAGPPSPVSPPAAVAMPSAARPSLRERIDSVLPWAWGMGSLAAMGALALAGARLARRRRAWAPETVAGERVLVSDAVGPAVVGFVRPRIVLPRWTLAWAEPLQRLILRHEREHVRAGDPRLLLAGLIAVAVMPWSPALWWQLRRLRLALEVDCDARTLRGQADVLAYGRLLLEVGRLGGGSPAPLVAFSEPRSFLEQRITAMTTRIPRDRARRALAWGALGALAAVTAAALPAPARPHLPTFARDATPALPAAPAARPLRADTSRVYALGEVDRQPVVTNSAEVARLIATVYPPLLRDAGVQGEAVLDIIVGEDGSVRSARVATVTHQAFREPALAGVNRMRFRPARKGGKAVAVRLSLPVEFQLRNTASVPLGPVSAPNEVAGMRQAEAWIRRELAARYPRVAAEGTSGRQYVWFLVDPAGNVLRSGTGTMGEDGAHWDMQALDPQLRAQLGDAQVQSIFWGAVHVAGPASPVANVAWLTSER